MTNERPIVIYHGGCPDGFGAMFAFWLKFKDEYEYLAAGHSDAPPDLTDRTVIMVDFCYGRDVIEEIMKVAKHVTILDHHVSAMNALEDFEHSNLDKRFDMTMSGAVLADRYVNDYPESYTPTFFLMIQDRDLWKNEIHGSAEFCAALYSYEYDVNVWHTLYDISKFDIMYIIKEGEIILRRYKKDVNETVKKCRRMTNIGGFDVPIASLPYIFASDGCDIMAEGYPFAASYYDTATDRRFSLRSKRDGEDVSLIAMTYGGGGHKHASGFIVPRDHDLAKI